MTDIMDLIMEDELTRMRMDAIVSTRLGHADRNLKQENIDRELHKIYLECTNQPHGATNKQLTAHGHSQI